MYSNCVYLVLIFLLISSVELKGLRKLIESSKEIVLTTISKECNNFLKQNYTCSKTYQEMYPNDDDKSLCCFLYKRHDCLEKLIVDNCSENDYKIFYEDTTYNTVFKNVQNNRCKYYPDVDSCHFPVKKTLIISGSVLLAIVIVTSAILYHRHKTGFRKINPNAV